MNGAHLHLLLNHVPVIGAILGTMLLIIAMLLRKGDIFRSGLILLVVSALIGIPAYVTGEPAEELVEDVSGVSHDAIEEHEEAALSALIAIEATGLVALVGLVVYRRAERLPGGYLAASVIVALIAMVALARTAYLGGEIRHPEIHTPEARLLSPQPSPAPHASRLALLPAATPSV